MKRNAAIMALFLVLGLAASTAHASRAARELTVEYAKYVLAFRGKSVEPIRAQMVPGWVGRKSGQLISRQAMLDMTQRLMDSTRAVKDMCVKLGKINDRGSTITVLINESADLIISDTRGRDRHVVTSGHSRDTWARTPSGLKLVRSEVLDERVKMDGVTLSPNESLPI